VIATYRMLTQFLRWPERVLGPRLTLKEANLICWGLFFALLAPAVYRAEQGQNRIGRLIPDVDFVNFYAMGRILNEYPAAELYDADLQTRIRTQVHPLSLGSYGPIPYPPFIGLLFQPFARLPYATAYHLWLSISLALYIVALVMVSARFFPGDLLRLSLICCLALCYFPFVIETLVNGQLSTIGFFTLALAFLLQDSERFFLSGLALSLCAYKPTLVLLLVPMLFVTKRFKLLTGAFTGAVALLLFTTVVSGTQVWPGYLGLLFRFGRASIGVQTGSILNLTKYVDLVAFSSLLPHGRSWPALAMLFGCALWAAFSLVRAWWNTAGAGKAGNRLAWSATLTWTLLLNIYVPVYDTILVVLSILITAGALKDAPREPLRRFLSLLWPVILVASWVTVHCASAWHIQIITVLLAALGVVQLRILRTATAPVSRQTSGVGAAKVSP
jgi:hypothetical protein